MQFWHVVEVHAIDRADECGCEEDGGPGRDLLDLLVLCVAGGGEALDLFVLGLADEGGLDDQGGLVELEYALQVLAFAVGDASDAVELGGDVGEEVAAGG